MCREPTVDATRSENDDDHDHINRAILSQVTLSHVLYQMLYAVCVYKLHTHTHTLHKMIQ